VVRKLGCAALALPARIWWQRAAASNSACEVIMNKRHLLLAISISICVAIATHAGGVPEMPSGERARAALLKYYNVPNESRKVEVSESGRAVPVCTDDCEQFEVSPGARLAELWDAVVLFKAFMSKTMIDESFLQVNASLATEVLRKHSTDKCGSKQSQEQIASCVLAAMAKTSGLKMTRVVYDEGNKCESAWSFNQPQKLLEKRCAKATPSSNR